MNEDQQLHQQLDIIRTMDSVERSIMLSSAQKLYAEQTSLRDAATSELAALQDEAEVWQTRQGTAKRTKADAQSKIERALAIMNAIETGGAA